MKMLLFDVGGMSIKYAIMENENDKVVTKSIPTRVSKDDNYILDDIIDVIKENYTEDIKAIGISTAGVVDSKKGEIIFAGPTIPNYTGTKIKEKIESLFPVKCFVENDVNAAAFGEYNYSNYDGTTFCMTIGTGVGGAIIINDNIYEGFKNTAGEIGYMPFNNGYYQDHASTTYILNEASNRLNKKLTGLDIFERAKKNDKVCLEIIDKFIDNLTTGMLNIIYILNPKQIIVGGGISAQKEYLGDKIISQLNKKLISEKFKTEINLAKLENLAGIYGMFYIIRKGLQ